MEAMRQARKVLTVLAVSAVVTLFIAPVSSAAPPERFTDQIDATFIDQSCGFPVTQHLEGTGRLTVFFDGDGNVVRTLGTFPGLRLSFSANGKTLSSASPAVDIDTFNEDGTTNVFIAGLLGHFSIPGQGIVAIDTGLRIFLFSASGPDLVFRVGASNFDTFEGPIAQLCDALADP